MRQPENNLAAKVIIVAITSIFCVVGYMLLYDKLFRTTPRPSPPIVAAAESDDEKAIRDAISVGRDLNVRNEAGESAIVVSTRHHNWRISELLLEKGANINSEDRYGRTALDDAHIHVDQERVHWLIQRGANHGSAPYFSQGTTDN